MRYVLLFVVLVVVLLLWMRKNSNAGGVNANGVYVFPGSDVLSIEAQRDLAKWQMQAMQNDLHFWKDQILDAKELELFNAGKTYGSDGFNVYGLDRDGYNREGYDKDGFNRKGYDWFGNKKSDSFINKPGCDPKVCNGYGDHWTEVRLAMDGTCYYYDITDSILNFKAVYRLPCAKNNIRLGKKYEPIFGIHTPI